MPGGRRWSLGAADQGGVKMRMELTMHTYSPVDRLAWRNEAKFALRDPHGVLDVYERAFVRAIFDGVLDDPAGLSLNEREWLGRLSGRVQDSVEEMGGM